MSVNENIKHVRILRGIKQRELAEKLGISQNHLSQIESGKRNVSVELLEKVANELGLTCDYMLEGNNPIGIPKSALKDTLVSNTRGPINTDLIQIPLLDKAMAASCGGGNGWFHEFADTVEMIYIDRSAFINFDDLNPPFAVYSDGDSMEGAGIEDGAQIVVNPAETIHSGDVACVWWDNLIIIKWIIFERNGDITLKPANPSYQPLVIDKEYTADTSWFKILGKVVRVTNRPRRAF